MIHSIFQGCDSGSGEGFEPWRSLVGHRRISGVRDCPKVRTSPSNLPDRDLERVRVRHLLPGVRSERFQRSP